MQKGLGVFTAAAATAAVVLLSACSSGGSQGSTSTLPSSGSAMSRIQSLSDPSRSGIAPKYLGAFHVHAARNHGISDAKKVKDLYVDDFGYNAVEVLKNGSWTNSGSITSSISGPDGNWVDKKGNLYVANYGGPDITEYNKAGSLTYTYGGVEDPVGVTTDSHGNVYEADFEGGYVTEFPQGSSTVTAQCSPGGDAEGVAVDKAGDVFVSWTNFSEGFITEYKGGLSGCSGTQLGATVGFPGGLVLDKHNNILIADQYAGVDIIDPPYSSITGVLGSSSSLPFHVTLNKNNKQAYIDSYDDAEVLVVTYPGGSTTATLNSSNGLSTPSSAVDSLNYNP